MAEQQQQSKTTEPTQTAAADTTSQAEVTAGGEGTSMKPVQQKSAPLQRQRGLARGRELSPFSMMRHFADEIDRAFSSMLGGRTPLLGMSPFELIAAGGWVPAIESFVEDGKIVLSADLPGMRPEDVKVEVSGDELVISGERVQQKREETEGGYYSERQYGCFERRVTLPEGCDPDKVEATFEDGVLTVKLDVPQQKQTSRKIEVKSKAGKGESAEGKSAQADKGEIH